MAYCKLYISLYHQNMSCLRNATCKESNIFVFRALIFPQVTFKSILFNACAMCITENTVW